MKSFCFLTLSQQGKLCEDKGQTIFCSASLSQYSILKGAIELLFAEVTFQCGGNTLSAESCSWVNHLEVS